MIKVKDYPNLYRDERSGAIINRNTSDYQQRLKAIKSSNKQEDEMKKMREDIDELKNLLKILVEKNIS
mgnify:CR=1 FL=1|tara:strand:- start:622 stop:825 length:204 start_codon:yes stop_codon:yes gene_type:complete